MHYNDEHWKVPQYIQLINQMCNSHKVQLDDILKEKTVAVMLWMAFCWNDLWPLVPIVGTVTTNQ